VAGELSIKLKHPNLTQYFEKTASTAGKNGCEDYHRLGTETVGDNNNTFCDWMDHYG
jgi:hypothetical protein